MEVLLSGFVTCFPDLYAFLYKVPRGFANPRLFWRLMFLGMASASDCVTASLRVCQREGTLCVSCEWCVETPSSGDPGCEVLWVKALCLSAL